MPETALAKTNGTASAPEDGAFGWSRQELELMKQTVARNTTDAQFKLFARVCQKTQLDPFAKQIHCVVRKTKDGPVMAIQTGIDGFRVIAKRSKKYRGQIGPMWCGPDGEWHDVWLEKDPPSAARVGVLHADFPEPLYAVARFDAYAPRYDGQLSGLWRTMGDVMIAKCAEGLALRKAFPDDLSGLYVEEEMEQANVVETPRTVVKAASRTAEVRERLRAAEAAKTETIGTDPISDLETQAEEAGLPLARGSDVASPEDADGEKRPQSTLRKKMWVYFKHAKIIEREAVLDYIEKFIVQRDLESTNDLSEDEVQAVIDQLEIDYGKPPRKADK